MSASVSVVIPCFRCTATIDRAIESVFEQTLRPFEVILVDDCSGDQTLVKLYEIKARYPKGWVKVVALQKNEGAGTARNKGWELSMQEYIAFLDADDSWHPKKIEIQYGWMIDNKHAQLSGHLCAIEKNERSWRSSDHVDGSVTPRVITKAQLLFSNKFMTPTVMLKRDVDFRMISGRRYSEDYDLWLRMAFSGAGCYFFDVKLACLHKAAFGAAGLSANLVAIEKGEISNYLNLHKADKISALTLTFVLGYSLAKFCRRYIVVIFKKLFLDR